MTSITLRIHRLPLGSMCQLFTRALHQNFTDAYQLQMHMYAPNNSSTCLYSQSGSQRFSLCVWYPPCPPAPAPAAVVHVVQDVQCLLCNVAVRVVQVYRVVLQQFLLSPVGGMQHVTQIFGTQAQKVPKAAAGFELCCVTCQSIATRSTT